MFPEQFLERMEQMLGEEYPAFLDSLRREPCRALRVNPQKSRWLEEQGGFHLTPVEWSENGYYYEEDDRPGRHPFHAAGAYYIQDASAQAVVSYLDPRPGERVLDLCGAPGGKSTQIGAAMAGRGILFCNEIHPARAKILSENVERMGIANGVVTGETPQRLLAAFEEYFHRILVDAPCSGEGMFRKNGEACGEWSPENVRMCAERQDEILDCAAGMLRPGGRLVYSTCTFAPAEDEGTVGRFLTRHPEFSPVSVERYPGMEPGCREWLQKEEGPKPNCGRRGAAGGDLEGTIRLWPHKIRGEGHFLAVLEKAAGSAQRRDPRLWQGVKKREYAPFLEFAAENLASEAVKRLAGEGEFILFGEQLYLLPEGCPCLEKLKVLRPGLHLGTIRKNRFEPAHALALALSPGEVKRAVSFHREEREVAGYLAGQTLGEDEVCKGIKRRAYEAGGAKLSAREEGLPAKGWYLIAVEGMSLGWGKYDGRVMKNHYPRGLRW